MTGHLYMAGPYKGAPLSAVIITPAVAGPFDLGVVVVRAAIYLDPETALVRTVSDPLPTILDGIPLDLRSATVRLARPKFTLNPTSCEPKSALATTTSVFGQPAALMSRFQVGGCKALPFRPKLHTRLFGPIHRGGHPRLRAVFEAKPGEANSARIVFALPKSEFIDQAHFRTICTRVQFAANQCPAGLGLRPRQSDHPAARLHRWKARSTCAPQATSCPTSSPRCGARRASRSRSTSTAAWTRSTVAFAPPSKPSPTPR